MKVESTEVEKLLCGFKDGNEGDFDRLYTYTKDLLYYFAFSITRDRQIAEDVVQETFVKIYRGAGGYRPKTSALSWMLKITKNAAIDENEKRPAIVVKESVIGCKSHEFAVTGTLFVDFVLGHLKKPLRQVVVMHLYGEYTYPEIAEILGISASAAEWRYRTAMKKLRALLEKEGVRCE